MNLDTLAVATLRSLSIDAINKAKSGHPGMPIGSAPLMVTLFSKHLVSDPQHPNWINRDRFVLSAGHASMLLYGILHVAGYDLSLDDIKKFRQLHSLTPGHPEVHLTSGVDATTGPLGQGIAQAVGFALAERTLHAMYKDQNLVDHYTYVLSGDGCLQEGISQEAISFAGHQKLNKLILFYDANQVTLDGPLSMSFSEDVKMRFLASGWQVLVVDDGDDMIAIDKAIKKAKKSHEKPTMIMVKTIIGLGSKNQGTYKVHGNPLGEEDGLIAKQSYGFNHPPFTIPQEVYDFFQSTFAKRGKKAFSRHKKTLKALKISHPSLYQTFEHGEALSFDTRLATPLMTFPNGYKDATRNTSNQVIQKLAAALPMLVGGSADVAKSVMTTIQQRGEMSPLDPSAPNINFGIREFAMASIQNGMMLHKGLRAYTGTFLAFADYMKPAIRLAALSHIPSIFLFSHDSVALGEDGPTHQPIDQLAMLRSIPNITVFRPADANETLGAWLEGVRSTNQPTVIVLTRQNLPLLPTSKVDITNGGYVLVEGQSVWTLVATGSEVSLAVEVAETFAKQGKALRVVSMPSMERFLALPKKEQRTILGTDYHHVITIEALSTFGWAAIGEHNLGINTFGQSAPGPEAMAYFGFNHDGLVAKVKTIIDTAK
jgi:transketolase